MRFEFEIKQKASAHLLPSKGSIFVVCLINRHEQGVDFKMVRQKT